MMTSVLKQPLSKIGLTVVVILSLIGLFVGCGGGIRGTGGVESTEVSGRLVNLNGTGIEGATIRVLESGDESSTGADGEFIIQTELPSGELSLAVQTANADTTVSLGAVPKTQKSVTVVLELDDSENSVTVISTNIPDHAGPQPQDTPSVSTPAPNPTVTFTEIPNTPLPQATPTAIVTPTSIATVAPTPQPNIYRGVLQRPNGSIYQLALITILDTGDSGITDSSGHFSISTDPVAGDITIQVGNHPEITATIPNVPSGGGFVIELVIVYETITTPSGPASSHITIESVNITPAG